MTGRISVNISGNFTTDSHMENIATKIGNAVKEVLAAAFIENSVNAPMVIVNTSGNNDDRQ